MAKQVLIVSATSDAEKLEPHKKRMHDKYVARGAAVHLINPKRVAYAISKGKVEIYYKGSTLPKMDLFVCFSTLGRQRAVGVLQWMLEVRDNTYSLDGNRYMREDSSKLFTSIERALDGSGPETYLAFSKGAARRLVTTMPFPAVMKPVDGRRGEGVIRMESRYRATEPINIFFNGDDEEADGDVPIMFQKYIQIKQEYRVVLLDGKVVAMVRKLQRGNPNNDAGFAKMVKWGGGWWETSKHEKPIALAEEMYGHTQGLLGIDIVWDGTTNKRHVIEANRAPGAWDELLDVTGIDLAELVVEASLSHV